MIIRNVDLALGDGSVRMLIPRLCGSIAPVDGPLTRDGVAVQIAAARIEFTPASLAALMNRYVFVEAPLSSIALEALPDGTLGIHARYHGWPVPTIRATLRVVDGSIRLHPLSFARLIAWATMWGAAAEHGLTRDANDLVLDARALVRPLIDVTGTLTDIRVANGRVVEIFGAPQADPDPALSGFISVEGRAIAEDGRAPFVYRFGSTP
jgi:hypothetical protein